ncbi:hypothetical protein LXL04_021731 [Taraxacum kok-saghyz]
MIVPPHISTSLYRHSFPSPVKLRKPLTTATTTRRHAFFVHQGSAFSFSFLHYSVAQLANFGRLSQLRKQQTLGLRIGTKIKARLAIRDVTAWKEIYKVMFDKTIGKYFIFHIQLMHNSKPKRLSYIAVNVHNFGRDSPPNQSVTPSATPPPSETSGSSTTKSSTSKNLKIIYN